MTVLNILVETAWLGQHLDNPALRILDVRASDPRLPIGYRSGHIPEAVALDPTRDFFVVKGPEPELGSPEQIAQALSEKGISAENAVIIYDEWTGPLAALTYWVLCYAGHRNAHILHGGWARWRQEGRPVTRDVPTLEPAVYAARPDELTRATAEWIQSNADRPDLFLLDARTPDEYAMGHIPGAANLSFDAALDVRSQTFKAKPELEEMLQVMGATRDKEIVTYCAAGARSAHMFTTLRLLGYPRVRNYDGSMTDWLKVKGLPVE